MKPFIIFAFSFFLAGNINAQSNKNNFILSNDLEQSNLWQDDMPDKSGSRNPEIITEKGSVTNVSTPRLIVYRPKNPNGTAILVISGGGYAHIELGKESNPTAIWLQSEGITAFELIYRLPQEGWKTTNVPFEDAQRAMRMVRSMANKYGFDPNKIGILGFSAGGHLAGITSTLFNKQFYKPVDSIDSLSSKPNFTGVVYPVISMLPPNNKTHSFKSILGNNSTIQQQTELSVEKQVTATTPPTFLAQAFDDPISPVENSFLMEDALRKAKVPAEMHIFQNGGHGWGLGMQGSTVSSWSDLFKNWAQSNGFWKK